MSSVRKSLTSVKRKLRVMCLVDSLLWGLIIFLAFYVGGVFFSLDWKIPATIGAVFFLLIFVRAIKKTKLHEAEKRIPHMEWQLRTAEDTVNKDNDVVRSLHQDVMNNVKRIHTSTLLDKKKIVKQTVFAVMLFALIFVIPATGFTADNVKDNLVTGFSAVVGSSSNFFGGEDDNERDIYGEGGEINKNGEKQLSVELQKSESELDLDKIQEEKGLVFTGQSPLSGLGVRADASYDEDLGENKELVEKYFKNLAES